MAQNLYTQMASQINTLFRLMISAFCICWSVMLVNVTLSLSNVEVSGWQEVLGSWAIKLMPLFDSMACCYVLMRQHTEWELNNKVNKHNRVLARSSRRPQTGGGFPYGLGGGTFTPPPNGASTDFMASPFTYYGSSEDSHTSPGFDYGAFSDPE
eukprot:CAMPEP_0175174788 /NCGR_PEP_ID=MMETSP0087-20121206/32834_1 /TAXON_ID=136419 /ORGANISM="Unknown Unknown, Strain D1" /LENGTH=153 /DNA_ID=CAMNT_0016466311 /DNA_START=264 /DNA_END=725 /DNA_ORIENTATION=-